jgi:hypothetical protein
MSPNHTQDLQDTLDRQADEEIVEVGPDGTIRTPRSQSLVRSDGKKTALHDPKGEFQA